MPEMRYAATYYTNQPHPKSVAAQSICWLGKISPREKNSLTFVKSLRGGGVGYY
ncbi:MAG: hypothetical protein QOF66_6082 [Mycobacterium sp.]|jgi:hypothetical protein|nr:hypothetical protein [Mycobacterium sp.]